LGEFAHILGLLLKLAGATSSDRVWSGGTKAAVAASFVLHVSIRLAEPWQPVNISGRTVQSGLVKINLPMNATNRFYCHVLS